MHWLKDTLITAAYPFYEEDPFIISTQPQIYFCGNQPKFQTKIFEGMCVTWFIFYLYSLLLIYTLFLL